MDIDRNNAEMPDIESSIESCKSEMEDACKEFLKATEEFVSEWYKNIIKSGLNANAKTAIEMGEDGLRKIKTELNELLLKLPELVEKHVNTDKWLHRGELPEGFNRRFGINLVKDLSNNHLRYYVQTLLGYVGGLLMKHGLADSKWETKSGDELPTYKVACIWPEKMENALRKYADCCDKWINLANDLTKIEKKKSESEISDLWDKL
ncbi:MAG: hypothetical protein Q7U10_03925 [Thermodesulfovibrionia bacterium]|nr:hypothetical protein [Thermodesulfovibrionia bacterium]